MRLNDSDINTVECEAIMAIWPMNEDGGASSQHSYSSSPPRHQRADDRASENVSSFYELDPDNLPRPPHQEVVFAAQEILIATIKERKSKGDPIPDPARYRGKVISELKKPENWWQVYSTLGYDLGDPPVPDIEEKKPVHQRTPSDNGKFLLDMGGGREEWVSEETYMNIMFDYDGDPSDEFRSVRYPVDWLRLKHESTFNKMRELVRSTSCTVEQLLVESSFNNREKYKRMLGEYDLRTDTYEDPRGWQEKDLFLLDRNEAFREIILDYHRANKAKASSLCSALTPGSSRL